MIISPPKSEKEVKRVIDIHAEFVKDDTLFPYNVNTAYLNYLQVRKQDYYKTIKTDDGEIVGGCHAKIHIPDYTNVKLLQVMFYICKLKGIGAFRAATELHRDLIAYAEAKYIPYVLSVSGYFDEDAILAKILEKDGWLRKGYGAVWATSHAKQPRSMQAASRI